MVEDSKQSALATFEELASKNAAEAVQRYLEATKSFVAAERQQRMLTESFRMSGLDVHKDPKLQPFVKLQERLDQLKTNQHNAFNAIQDSVASSFAQSRPSEDIVATVDSSAFIYATAKKLADGVLEQHKDELKNIEETAAKALLKKGFEVVQETMELQLSGVNGHGGHQHELLNGDTLLVDSTPTAHVSHITGNGHLQHIGNAGEVVFSRRQGISPRVKDGSGQAIGG